MSKIPDFATIEEEAEFWDTHDFTDFLDETRPVTLRVADPLEKIVTVRLEPSELVAIEKLAHDEGTTVSALAHRWISEQLRKRSA